MWTPPASSQDLASSQDPARCCLQRTLGTHSPNLPLYKAAQLRGAASYVASAPACLCVPCSVIQSDDTGSVPPHQKSHKVTVLIQVKGVEVRGERYWPFCRSAAAPAAAAATLHVQRRLGALVGPDCPQHP